MAEQPTVQERRASLLTTLYGKLDDPELPAHAFARITSSIAALEKIVAQDEGDDEPLTPQLGPALKALPPAHARELVQEEIERLKVIIVSYEEILADLGDGLENLPDEGTTETEDA